MLSNTLLTIITIPIIMTSMFLIGAYISKSQEIFLNNDFASFILGAMIYFVITFAAFFPFLWTISNQLYYIIIFFIKEALLYIILALKWEKEIIKLEKIKKLIVMILSGIIITFVYHFGISKIIKIQKYDNQKYFETWYQFKMVFTKSLFLGDKYASTWFFPIFVSSIGYASVASFIGEFLRTNNFSIMLGTFFSTFLILIFFSFGLPLEQLLGVFLILFTIVSAVRLINLSRRRYGVTFGLSTIVIFSINSDLISVILIVAFATMVIYTFLRKPKNSLFWIQLFAPIGIVESLTLFNYSRILSLLIFILASLSYIFMISVGRLKLMDKINVFFDKTRVIIPIIVFIIIFAISLTLFSVENFQKHIFEKYYSYSYTSFMSKNNTIEYVCQITIYLLSIFLWIIFLIYSYIQKRKLSNYTLLVLVSLIITVFVYNPITNIIFQNLNLKSGFALINAAVFMPSIVLMPIIIINTINKQLLK